MNDPLATEPAAGSGFQLAQYNIGTVHHPLDHPGMADFTSGLEIVNQLAEASPGFVWRLTDDDGKPSSYVVVDDNADPLSLVNMSVWESVEELRHFIYSTSHVGFLRRRSDWFQSSDQPTSICWWIPANTVPTVADAQLRLDSFIANGPSDGGWSLGKPIPPPSGTAI